jgi:hypothetical protein
MVAILDPPREEAVEAIKIAHKAGITVKMITGAAARLCAYLPSHVTHWDSLSYQLCLCFALHSLCMYGHCTHGSSSLHVESQSAGARAAQGFNGVQLRWRCLLHHQRLHALSLRRCVLVCCMVCCWQVTTP